MVRKESGAGYQEYDFKKWFDTIQQYEGIAGNQVDDCMLFGAEAYTTVRWIGNENGFAAEETWSKSNVDKEKIRLTATLRADIRKVSQTEISGQFRKRTHESRQDGSGEIVRRHRRQWKNYQRCTSALWVIMLRFF